MIMKPDEKQLLEHLKELKLAFIRQNYPALLQQGAQKQWPHMLFLHHLIEGETHQRRDNKIKRRLRAARFPVIKTLQQFDWSWPAKVNRSAVQNLFRLHFIKENSNVVLLGGVGLGKTHLAIALAHAACLMGEAVLFTIAVDIINTLSAAQAAYRLKPELKKFLSPRLLVIDELGYLPIDKTGADLLFQVISQRYEHGSIVLTTNQPFKKWARIFNNDSTLTSAVLDRLLHHAEVITITGKSYRMKEQIEDEIVAV